jgi:hypothetical protein
MFRLTMTSKLSVLQNFREDQLRRSPFPYLVIENALPEEIYEELSGSFPPESLIFEHHRRKQPDERYKPNTRYDLPAGYVRANEDLDLGLWREFSEYHSSQEFLDELLLKLGDVIHETHPHIIDAMQKKSPLSQPRAGVRYWKDGKDQSEIALDCQISINSPATAPDTSVRTAHIDNPVELFAGLLYLRHPEDRAKGGDLEIYSWKNPRRKRIGPKRIIAPEDVVVQDCVTYGPNKLALFINSIESVHGVTNRDVSDKPRRLVNIIGEVYPTQKRVFNEWRYHDVKSWMNHIKRKVPGTA